MLIQAGHQNGEVNLNFLVDKKWIQKRTWIRKNNSGSKTKITLKNITKSFSGITVLNNINLEFTSGEIHGLVGQNGAGKSTLGKIIGGHYKLSSGNIFLNDNLIKNGHLKLHLIMV